VTEENKAEDLLWSPSASWIGRARITDYRKWLAQTRGLDFSGYRALWQWSVNDLAGSWSSVWDYFDVLASVLPETALADDVMPGAVWFPGARLNWAQNLLRERPGEASGIVSVDEESRVF
jgi:acetoacetyl-CoA synthetase